MDEKQKKALKEKYKEHRRAVWRGETSRSKRNEIEEEDRSPEQQSVVSDEYSKIFRENDVVTVIDITPEEHVIEDSRESDSETTVIDNQSIGREIDDTVIEQSETTELDNVIDQAQWVHSNSNNESQYELIEKIKEQRRATWAGESSSKAKLKDRNRKRKTPEVEQKVQDELNEEKGGITWKLAIAVIIGITGAIGLGVYLGYIIASYL